MRSLCSGCRRGTRARICFHMFSIIRPNPVFGCLRRIFFSGVLPGFSRALDVTNLDFHRTGRIEAPSFFILRQLSSSRHFPSYPHVASFATFILPSSFILFLFFNCILIAPNLVSSVESLVQPWVGEKCGRMNTDSRMKSDVRMKRGGRMNSLGRMKRVG